MTLPQTTTETNAMNADAEAIRKHLKELELRIDTLEKLNEELRKANLEWSSHMARAQRTLPPKYIGRHAFSAALDHIEELQAELEPYRTLLR